MTQALAEAVKAYLEEADERELDRQMFFLKKGMWVVVQEDPRLPLVVYEPNTHMGTMVPAIRIGLGAQIATEVLPKYFEVQNVCLMDPIKGRNVAKLPELHMVSIVDHVLISKGLIDGNFDAR